MIFKVFWVLRGLIYKPFLGAFGFPSYIGKPVFIANFKRIFIGRKVRIFPGSRLEVIGKKGSIIIKNNVSIGHGFHAISGTSPLIISKNVTISANVFIANTEHTYNQKNKHIMNQDMFFKKTCIGENCFIGYGAVIQAGTILGKQCIVGANSVVRGEFPDYSVIVGAPARIVKRYDEKTKSWKKTDRDGCFRDE